MHINPPRLFSVRNDLLRLKPAFYVVGRQSHDMRMEKLAKAMQVIKSDTAIVLTSDGSPLGIITVGDMTR